MDPHSNSNNTNVNGITLQPMTNTINALKKVEDIKHFLGQYQLPDLLKIFDKLTMPSSKKSFLVFKQTSTSMYSPRTLRYSTSAMSRL